MRVLTSSVLVMEAIVLGLAIPVALVVGGQPTWFAWVLGVLALIALLLPGLARRPYYLSAGWAVQAALLACGAFSLITSGEWILLLLGVVFAALWWTAVHLGGKVEAARAAQVPPGT
jgi:hypothetical protein